MPDLNSAVKPIHNTQHCVKCAANTTHLLVPSKHGADWKCQSCQITIHAFSQKEMVEFVMRRVFGLPKDPKPVDIPGGFKVFMRHHGPGADEKEVSTESIREHVRLTGTLPEVGKPMFAAPKGVAHKALAVPYGEVTRVEYGE